MSILDDLTHPQKPAKEIIQAGAAVVDKQAPDTLRDLLLVLCEFRTRFAFVNGGLEVTFHPVEKPPL